MCHSLSHNAHIAGTTNNFGTLTFLFTWFPNVDNADTLIRFQLFSNLCHGHNTPVLLECPGNPHARRRALRSPMSDDGTSLDWIVLTATALYTSRDRCVQCSRPVGRLLSLAFEQDWPLLRDPQFWQNSGFLVPTLSAYQSHSCRSSLYRQIRCSEGQTDARVGLSVAVHEEWLICIFRITMSIYPSQCSNEGRNFAFCQWRSYCQAVYSSHLPIAVGIQ